MSEKDGLPEQNLEGMTPFQAEIVKIYDLNFRIPGDWEKFNTYIEEAKERGLATVEDLRQLLEPTSHRESVTTNSILEPVIPVENKQVFDRSGNVISPFVQAAEAGKLKANSKIPRIPTKTPRLVRTAIGDGND